MDSLPASGPALAAGHGPRGTSRAKPWPWQRLVYAGLAYIVAVIFLLPYLEMIISALRPANEMLDADYLPTHFNFHAFIDIWSTGFGQNLRISLEVAAGSTLLVLLVAIPAAYYTARQRFRGRAAFMLLVLVTQMFQPTAMLVGLYREFLDFGMLDSVLALILVNAGFNMAFAVWILNAYVSAIPSELEEAAFIDGSTRLGVLFRITLPLALPGIVTALIFTFISAWNEFIVALTLTTSQATEPLTVALNAYIGQYQVDWSHLFAGSVIATIPVIILFALIEGKVVGGLTAGSIK
jgi:multiple sugar transport system permease protein